MNLPVNNIVVKEVFLEELVSSKLFEDLENKNFTGYLALTVNGKHAFEESFIIFDNGKITGAIYIVEKFDILLYGKDAFNYCINSYGAKEGILNIYELSQDQLKLILLFNKNINYKKVIYGKKLKKDKKHFLNNINYRNEDVEKLFEDKIKIKQTKKELLDDRYLDDLLDM